MTEKNSTMDTRTSLCRGGTVSKERFCLTDSAALPLALNCNGEERRHARFEHITGKGVRVRIWCRGLGQDAALEGCGGGSLGPEQIGPRTAVGGACGAPRGEGSTGKRWSCCLPPRWFTSSAVVAILLKI